MLTGYIFADGNSKTQQNSQCSIVLTFKVVSLVVKNVTALLMESRAWEMRMLLLM